MEIIISAGIGIVLAIIWAIAMYLGKTWDIPPETPIMPPEPPVEPPKPDLVALWAEAIAEFESGGDKNALNYRRKNPGNIKGLDGKFLQFDTWNDGMEYLKDYLRRACTGAHKAYKPTMTLKQAMTVYAPDPEPIPTNYANHCAKKMGVYPSIKLSEIYPVGNNPT